jgi:phosphoribosylformylglycinamidine (FGAM) synthase-like amidotransferase family enzyme
LKTLFRRMDNIKIEYENLKIEINDKSAVAEMDVRIIATIGNDTGYVLGDMPHPAHLKFTLEKERTKWLVTKVEGLPGAY